MRPRTFLAFLALIWIIFLTSCEFSQEPKPTAVGLLTWNTQNLFDDEKNGNEYAEFDPDKGWTRKAYWDRLTRCAQVITQAPPRLPDVVLLQELENAGVLETLRTRFLDPRVYAHSLLLANPGASVQVGILSRWPIIQSGILTPENPKTGGRPILEVKISTPNGDLYVFNNHWKSRLPDQESTEAARKQTAYLLKRRMDQLTALGQRFVAAGDFNTYPSQGVLGALGWGGEGVLGLGKKPGQGLPWDPWNLTEDQGSYWFRGNWEPLDHFLIHETGVALDFQVLKTPDLVDFQGHPRRWSAQTPKGISDHLPLWLELAP